LYRDTVVDKVISGVKNKNCCRTHSASNMNSLGLRIDQWMVGYFPSHYYFANHLLLSTVVKEYSGKILAVVGTD
jgi:hypothetical protein